MKKFEIDADILIIGTPREIKSLWNKLNDGKANIQLVPLNVPKFSKYKEWYGILINDTYDMDYVGTRYGCRYTATVVNNDTIIDYLLYLLERHRDKRVFANISSVKF